MVGLSLFSSRGNRVALFANFQTPSCWPCFRLGSRSTCQGHRSRSRQVYRQWHQRCPPCTLIRAVHHIPWLMASFDRQRRSDQAGVARTPEQLAGAELYASWYECRGLSGRTLAKGMKPVTSLSVSTGQHPKQCHQDACHHGQLRQSKADHPFDGLSFGNFNFRLILH